MLAMQCIKECNSYIKHWINYFREKRLNLQAKRGEDVERALKVTLDRERHVLGRVLADSDMGRVTKYNDRSR